MHKRASARPNRKGNGILNVICMMLSFFGHFQRIAGYKSSNQSE